MAAVWQTADPAAVVGTSGSLRTDSGTNKALADAQKQLRISQQQASTSLHMVTGSNPLVVHAGSGMISCHAACVWQPFYARKSLHAWETMLSTALAVTHCTSASRYTHITEECKHLDGNLKC